MELTFHPDLPSQIILGPRVSHSGDLSDQNEAQLVFVAILEATYSADDPSATTLEGQYLSLRIKDVFFNEIRDAHFSAHTSNIPGWELKRIFPLAQNRIRMVTN